MNENLKVQLQKEGSKMSQLYYNGTILTMDDDCQRVDAIFVNDGRIIKRGTLEEVSCLKDSDTVLVDLQGKTLMPAFLDGHSHFAGFADSLSQCDLSHAENFQDIICLMQEFIKNNKIPKGQWVEGTNYDHNFLKEKKHPDKRVLDQISSEHPIVLIHASSHMGAANSMALERQGINADTKDPEGGRYGRISGTREPDGYMEEDAFVEFRNQMPMPEIEELMKQFQKAQEIYAGYGITTVQEGMVTEALFPLLQYAEKGNVLFLDLVGYIDLENAAHILRENVEYTKEYRNHLKIGGYKIFLDGSPQGRTAWMKEPYEQTTDGYCGYPIEHDEKVYRFILTAMQDGQQLLAHCNGDAAAEQYITQFEKAKKEHPELDTCRPVMVHAQLVQEAQLERMKKIGMLPGFFVAHTYYWGDIHIENFGSERAGKISPAGTAGRLHLPFTFHQDSPVLPPDIFKTIWCAAVRVTKSGTELAQEERVSVYDGLKANTIYAAYQYGEEREKGSISEGKRADLIILDRNPLEIPVDEVKEVTVLETIKDGVAVYHRHDH